jgi:hypothetical protein
MMFWAQAAWGPVALALLYLRHAAGLVADASPGTGSQRFLSVGMLLGVAALYRHGRFDAARHQRGCRRIQALDRVDGYRPHQWACVCRKKLMRMIASSRLRQSVDVD